MKSLKRAKRDSGFQFLLDSVVVGWSVVDNHTPSSYLTWWNSSRPTPSSLVRSVVRCTTVASTAICLV